jgi:hypothetical protein
MADDPRGNSAVFVFVKPHRNKRKLQQKNRNVSLTETGPCKGWPTSLLANIFPPPVTTPSPPQRATTRYGNTRSDSHPKPRARRQPSVAERTGQISPAPPRPSAVAVCPAPPARGRTRQLGGMSRLPVLGRTGPRVRRRRGSLAPSRGVEVESAPPVIIGRGNFRAGPGALSAS